jgi:hypothetical protein
MVKGDSIVFPDVGHEIIDDRTESMTHSKGIQTRSRRQPIGCVAWPKMIEHRVVRTVHPLRATGEVSEICNGMASTNAD